MQVKYTRDAASRGPLRGRYADHLAHNVVYGLEEFWRATADAGLEPIALVLQPWAARVSDGPYAYYGALRRP